MGNNFENLNTEFSLNSGKNVFTSTFLYFSGSIPANGATTVDDGPDDVDGELGTLGIGPGGGGGINNESVSVLDFTAAT